jgi:hypothetical protein
LNQSLIFHSCFSEKIDWQIQMEWNDEFTYDDIERQVKLMVNQVSRNSQKYDTKLSEKYEKYNFHYPNVNDRDKKKVIVPPISTVKNKGIVPLKVSNDRYDSLSDESNKKSLYWKQIKKPCKRRQFIHEHASSSSTLKKTSIGYKISKEKQRLQLEIKKGQDQTQRDLNSCSFRA